MKRMFLIFVLSVMAVFAIQAATVEAQFNSPKPPTKNNGEKWRIAYYEGGEYIDYQSIFAATIEGLMERGWIEKTQLPQMEGEETETLWKWLANEAKSDYLLFVEDAHYCAGWDEEKRKELQKALTDRLNRGDIDLLLAFGTWAGQDFANNDHSVDTLIISASDPVAAGIIKSVEDSGYDHVHAHINPGQYARQVRTFHDMVAFRTMGIAYEDTESGRSIAGLDQIEPVTNELNFEIIPCHTIDDTPDKSKAENSAIQCYNELVRKADAIYVTLQNGVNPNTISRIVSMAQKYKKPTFAQGGSKFVKNGLLISIAQVDFSSLGQYEAAIIASVLNGEKPRNLPQDFHSPLKIAINLETAEKIGYTPSADVFISAEEIFEKITRPKEE